MSAACIVPRIGLLLQIPVDMPKTAKVHHLQSTLDVERAARETGAPARTRQQLSEWQGRGGARDHCCCRAHGFLLQALGAKAGNVSALPLHSDHFSHLLSLSLSLYLLLLLLFPPANAWDFRSDPIAGTCCRSRTSRSRLCMFHVAQQSAGDKGWERALQQELFRSGERRGEKKEEEATHGGGEQALCLARTSAGIADADADAAR